MKPEDAVGITDEPTTIPVERGKIREFALACFDGNPEYTQAASPPVPPTFLTVRNFWMTGATSPLARVGLDLRRLLHGGEEYVFHGSPPRAGDELTMQTRIDKVYEKQGKRGGTMTFVESVTQFCDPDGTVRVECRSTAIETAQPPSSPSASDGGS
jgi:hydroxyacyl-ACP dehydratase HTD2-like protein with hotdog domain